MRNMVIIKPISIKIAIYFRSLNIFAHEINILVDFHQEFQLPIVSETGPLVGFTDSIESLSF